MPDIHSQLALETLGSLAALCPKKLISIPELETTTAVICSLLTTIPEATNSQPTRFNGRNVMWSWKCRPQHIESHNNNTSTVHLIPLNLHVKLASQPASQLHVSYITLAAVWCT